MWQSRGVRGVEVAQIMALKNGANMLVTFVNVHKNHSGAKKWRHWSGSQL